MITKAIIKSVPSASSEELNKYLVRIPIFDGTDRDPDHTPQKYLSYATCCCLPGLDNAYNIGDVVYVGFEDDDYARPVILGHLFMGLYPPITKTSASLHVGALRVEDELSGGASQAKLPEQSSIGSITVEDLRQLQEFMELLKESPFYQGIMGKNNS